MVQVVVVVSVFTADWNVSFTLTLYLFTVTMRLGLYTSVSSDGLGVQIDEPALNSEISNYLFSPFTCFPPQTCERGLNADLDTAAQEQACGM